MRNIGGWEWVRIMGLPCSFSSTHLIALGPTFALQLLIPLDEVLSVELSDPSCLQIHIAGPRSCLNPRINELLWQGSIEHSGKQKH